MPLNWGFPKRKPERGCKSQRYRRSADAPDQRGTRQHDDPFGGQHRWCERSESRSGPDGGLNATTGLYEVTVPSTTAEAPPLILTWTPASPPGNQNPSSTTPVVPKPVPVYEGVTLTPLKTEPESYPGVLLDLNDLIVIFPADSGVKPVYVMLSSPS